MIDQKFYQSALSNDALALVMEDLAVYCNAFKPDVDNLSAHELMKMHGRRQVYFRIVDHLKLTPNEMEAVYRNVVTKQSFVAQRLQRLAALQEGDE